MNHDNLPQNNKGHFITMELDPVQLSPPFCGIGFVHVLDIGWVPAQVAEQELDAAQNVHPPSTATRNRIFKISQK